MSKRLTLMGLTLIVFGLSGLRAADNGSPGTVTLDGKPVTLARYAKAYIGEGNVTVEVGPYKTKEGNEGAIIVIHGIEGDWDGKALNYRVEPGAYHGKMYVTQYHGKDWSTLQMRAPTTTPQWDLFIPDGGQSGIKVVPSDGAAQLTNPRSLYEEYQRQHEAAKKS
jgi:hypothetical protein